MKKQKRKLQLDRLTVVQLTTRELVKVKGGSNYTEGGGGGGGGGGDDTSTCDQSGGGWAASYDYC